MALPLGAKIGIGVGAVAVGVVAFGLWGLSLVANETCDHLRMNAQIRDRLGPLTTCEQRKLASGTVGDDDTFVYFIEGPKGAARAIVRSVTNAKGDEEFTGVLLEIGTEKVLVEGERPPGT